MSDSALAEPHPDSGAVTRLLKWLDAAGYAFVTPTPATHRRVLSHRTGAAGSLRDVFGWSLPFSSGLLEPDLWSLISEAGLVEEQGGLFKSRLRVSRLGDKLFAHSAFPTTQADAVFLGPDSYRFAAFIRRRAPRREGLDIIDLGAGAGVGGIVAAGLAPRARIVLADINPKAVALARANADAAGVSAEVVRSDGLQGVPPADVILANPPYIADPEGRTYRDGGGDHGEKIALDWAREAIQRLRPGGQMLLYTGAAVVAGRDPVREGLEAIEDAQLDYEELDPDVFGEELERPAYARVDRIAVVGAVLTKK